jgi:hypothetical protein
MKRISLTLAIWTCVAIFAAAEADHPLSVGAGGEITRFSRYAWSPGANIVLDYKLDEVFTLGLKGGWYITPDTANYETVNSVEISLIERFYLLNWGWGRFYLQGNMGAAIIREQDYQVVSALGGGTIGFRLFVKYWFIDLYGSFGYPKFFEGGLLLGHSFIP